MLGAVGGSDEGLDGGSGAAVCASGLPENLVVANFESLAEELTEREMVQQLKKRFDVSAEAMRYRLVNLGLATSL